MQNKFLTSWQVAVWLLALVSTACAGPLPSDPNAYAGYHGSVAFLATANGFALKANVEYAVYAPGQFDTSAALGFPAHVPLDPSGGTQYVYAYEILSDATSTASVLNLSVSLINNAIPSGSTNVGNDPLTLEGGIAPNFSLFIPGTDPEHNAKWSYSTGLAIGSHSDILLFTSPYGPQTASSAMQGGHATIATGLLPSPIPEPSTVALSIAGLACLIAAYSRRLTGSRCRGMPQAN